MLLLRRALRVHEGGSKSEHQHLLEVSLQNSEGTLPGDVEVRASLQPVFPSFVWMRIAVATWRVPLLTAENPDTDDTSADYTNSAYNVSPTGP